MNETIALDKVLSRLNQTRNQLDLRYSEEERTFKRTNRTIHGIFIGIGIIALVNIYYIGDFAQETRVIVRDMVTMYTQFGEMSERMSGMRHHVSGMEDNIALMPFMAEQMTMMSSNMLMMRADVSDMNTHMYSMTQRVGTMGQDIGSMNRLFRNVNGTLTRMHYHVNQMSRVVP